MTATRARRLTDSGTSADDSNGSSSRNSNGVFRRMSAQAMGLEANALCHRSHWVPKSTRSNCFNCRRSFRLWTKKHHCRFCGEVVCRNCSTQRILIVRKTLRSCDTCVRVNIQSIATHLARRNSLSALDSDSDMAVVAVTGRKSDGALLRKSLSLPPASLALAASSGVQPRGGNTHKRTARSSSAKRSDMSSGKATLQSLRRRYRAQLPYVVIVFLLTIAGLTNLLARRLQS